MVLLELSSAFDMLDHEILLNRLQNRLGINGSALQWLQSYLSNRKQFIVWKNEKSSCVDFNIGVPQGSVLGPLLFLDYMLPLKDIFEKHDVSWHSYADDTQVYCTFDLKDANAQEVALRRLSCCIDSVKTWMLNNKMRLNDQKTEFLVSVPKNYESYIATSR